MIISQSEMSIEDYSWSSIAGASIRSLGYAPKGAPLRSKRGCLRPCVASRRGFDAPSSDNLRARDCNEIQLLEIQRFAIGRPGGYSGAAAPDPIPNSAVKRPSAYDTSSQDAGKSVAARSANRKTSPLLHHKTIPKRPARFKPAGRFALPPIPGDTESRNHVKRNAGRETAPCKTGARSHHAFGRGRAGKLRVRPKGVGPRQRTTCTRPDRAHEQATPSDRSTRIAMSRPAAGLAADPGLPSARTAAPDLPLTACRAPRRYHRRRDRSGRSRASRRPRAANPPEQLNSSAAKTPSGATTTAPIDPIAQKRGPHRAAERDRTEHPHQTFQPERSAL